MPVIWGFDLSKMRWGAFRNSEMYSRKWYMRRERLILDQLAMNVCLAAECTATYSLAKYEDLQDNVALYTNYAAKVHNNDIIATQVLIIVFCVFVATVYGADMFFLIFWPERKYPAWYNVARIGLALFILLGVWAAALASTIVVAAHVAGLTGVDEQSKQQIIAFFYRPPLVYRDWPVNIAYIVLLWLGLVFTLGAFIAMLLGVRYEGNAGSGFTTVQPLPGYDESTKEGENELIDKSAASTPKSNV
ncbi:hypothetical protein H0H87_010494 [Tephrocybe sp. NHM501043]|nr:hypothetical protein H0H87_010494 [Tephrocybe sp. NHM501043]